MKLSQKQLLELTSALTGLDVELAENDNAEFDINQVQDVAEARMKPGIISKERDAIIAAHDGKMNGTIKAAIGRVLNIPRKDLESAATIEDALKKAKDILSTSGEANEYKDKYEKYVAQMEQELENKETAWQTKYDADMGIANQKYLDRDIDEEMLRAVNNMPIKGGDKIMQANMLRMAAERAGYTFTVVDKKLTATKDGRPVTKIPEALTEIGKGFLPIAESTAHIPPSKLPQSNADVVVDNPAFASKENVDAFDSWANA